MDPPLQPPPQNWAPWPPGNPESYGQPLNSGGQPPWTSYAPNPNPPAGQYNVPGPYPGAGNQGFYYSDQAYPIEPLHPAYYPNPADPLSNGPPQFPLPRNDGPPRQVYGSQFHVRPNNGRQGFPRRHSQGGNGTGRRRRSVSGSRGTLIGYSEPVDPGNFFVVFLILWSAPAGRSESRDMSVSEMLYVDSTFRNELIYHNVKRMVVVHEAHGSCWCLPISTYTGRGTTKYGLNPANHAVIYIGSEPPLLAGETGIVKRPIRVEPARPHIRLDKASRIDFGTVHTIEHNSAISEVGMVSHRSMNHLLRYWEQARNPVHISLRIMSLQQIEEGPDQDELDYNLG
ncbi:MAG: hypothetical protein M1816_002710 [Peltula sp. TS41687]|nr:MAG: hypothetical protein M1816_002710 [Peltula sp. TS41687]